MTSHGYLLGKYSELNREWGGRQAVLMGEVGSGKTTLLAYLTAAAAKGIGLDGSPREKQAAIWRGRQSDRFPMFATMVKTVVCVPKGRRFAVTLVQQDSKEETDLEGMGMEVTEFRKTDEIVESLTPGELRVVLSLYTPLQETELWADVLHSLATRTNLDWVNLAIDEAHNVFPPPTVADYSTQLRASADKLDLRRAFVNCTMAVHTAKLLNWMMLQGLDWAFYLKGAPKLRGSRVRQNYINQLRLGEAHLDAGSGYVLFKFPDFKQQNKLPYSLIIRPEGEEAPGKGRLTRAAALQAPQGPKLKKWDQGYYG